MTSSETSTNAFVSPNDFETWSASPTGAGSPPGPLDELRSIRRGFSTSGLLVVAPQAAAVHLCRAVVAGFGDQRRGEAVLEVARDGLNGAVVVGGSAGRVLGALDRLLRVVDRVVRVLVCGLVDGRGERARADQVALVGRAVVADEQHRLALLLLGGEDSVLGHAPVDVDAAQVGDRGQRGGCVLDGGVGAPVLGLVRLDREVGVLRRDALGASGGAVSRVKRG